MSKDQRKASLKVVAQECELMTNEDLARVTKLVKALLKSRTALDSIVEEVDAEE